MQRQVERPPVDRQQHLTGPTSCFENCDSEPLIGDEALPALEPTASERDANGVAGSLVRLVRPALQLGCRPCTQ